MKYLKDLFREIRGSLLISWKSSRLIFVFLILLECYQLVSPILIAYCFKLATNEVIVLIQNEDPNITSFVDIVIIMLIFQMLNVAISMIVEDLKEQHNCKMHYYINNTLLIHINKLDISYFDNPNYYSMIEKAARDSVAVSKLSTLSITFIRNIVQVILCGIILGTLNCVIPAVLMVFLVPFAIAQIKFLKWKLQYRDEKLDNDRHLQQISFVLKDKKYAKDLRIYHVQNFFFDRHHFYWEEGFKKQQALVKKKIGMFSITKIIPHLLTAGVLVVIVYRVVQGNATIGDFSYFKGITAQFIDGCNMIISSFVQGREGLEQMKNYNDFLKTEPIINYEGEDEIENITSIEFVDVCFTYPGTSKEILNNVNVKLDGKKIYSIVGKNGAGKSTFVKLLLRLYDPTKGKILVNGRDLRKINIHVYHDLLGVMFQDYNTYLLPIRENIALSDFGRMKDDARIYRACENGEFDCKNKKYKKGLDTHIGKLFDKEGVLLSGGESQRIAIARTYFKEDACFFVMDEPNSALDPEAEKKIFEKLMNLCQRKGAIFITHRMSSVSIANQILVFDAGKLVESGTHTELINANGVYSELYNIQADQFSKQK